MVCTAYYYIYDDYFYYKSLHRYYYWIPNPVLSFPRTFIKPWGYGSGMAGFRCSGYVSGEHQSQLLGGEHERIAPLAGIQQQRA